MPPDANDIAQGNGIYFNGVADGIDCDCCGDRWYPVTMTTHRHSLHHTVMVVVLLSTVTVTITWTMLAITGL